MAVELQGSLVLETAIRFITVGLYLATALVVFRWRITSARIAGTLAYVSKAAHTILHFPPIMAMLGWGAPPITFMATMGTALTWLFGIELFSDNRRFDAKRLLPVLGVLVIVIAAMATPPPVARALWLLHAFTTVALMGHLLTVLMISWRDDLVDRRKFIATPVFVVTAIYSIGLGFVENVKLLMGIAREPSLINAGILLFSSLLAIVVFGQFAPALFGDESEPEPLTRTQPARSQPRSELPPADMALTTALDELMRHERLYRTPGLRISDLAARLRVPEYRLRQLLNYGLGHRNFNAYISQWRIAEAKEALRDPEQVAVPISTIAIDSGFHSLAPFNRAFRGETGMTPSEYRAEAQARWNSGEERGGAE